MFGFFERDALVRLGDFRITFTICLTGHREVHADFRALAGEVVLEALRHFRILDDTIAHVMLGDEGETFALLQELRARNAAQGALLRSRIAFMHIAANRANPLSHLITCSFFFYCFTCSCQPIGNPVAQ